MIRPLLAWWASCLWNAGVALVCFHRVIPCMGWL